MVEVKADRISFRVGAPSRVPQSHASDDGPASLGLRPQTYEIRRTRAAQKGSGQARRLGAQHASAPGLLQRSQYDPSKLNNSKLLSLQ